MAQETPIEFTRQIDGFTNQRCGNHVVVDAGGSVIGHVVLDTGHEYIGSVAQTDLSCDGFTRPANINQYHAGDVVSNGVTAMMEFADAVREVGGSGWIVGATVWSDRKASVQNLVLKLFRVNTIVCPADHALDTVLWANRGQFIGEIDMGPMVPGADTVNSTASRAQNFNIRIGFEADPADTSIYGYFYTKTTDTPASQEQFYCCLRFEKN